MSGIFGIGGSSNKTDRKFQLQSWGDLQNLFGEANKRGTSTFDTGTGDVGKARDYWTALMSGDPTKMSQALAPQISAIKGQSGQAIRGLEQFSGRSGGTSAAVQAQNFEAQSAIQNLFDMMGPMSAQELEKLGISEQGMGAGLLSTAGSAASEIGSQAGQDRTAQGNSQMQTGQAIAQMAMLAMMA